MLRIFCLSVLLACGSNERVVGGAVKCSVDAECARGLYCSDGACVAPAKPLGESIPSSSNELYNRIGQSSFSLDATDASAHQAVLFKVGVGLRHGFTLEDTLHDAHFNLRFENDNVRMWDFSFSVPGKEVVVPPAPGETTQGGRFLLKNIRIRLMGDALAPIVSGEMPKASIDFTAPLVINADMGSGEESKFAIELHMNDVGIHVDLDVRARRLTARLQVSEQHLIYGQLDNLYIDGFSLDSVLSGVLLPSVWVDNLPE